VDGNVEMDRGGAGCATGDNDEAGGWVMRGTLVMPMKKRGDDVFGEGQVTVDESGGS